jgi:hypothetical protein
MAPTRGKLRNHVAVVSAIKAVLSGTKSRPNEGNCASAHVTDPIVFIYKPTIRHADS